MDEWKCSCNSEYNNRGCTIQTSKNNSTWTAVDNQAYTANGFIYVKLLDSENKVICYATGNITNIDTAKPTIPTVTTTSNSIIIQAADTGGSGIIGYTVTTDATIPTEFTSCENTNALEATVENLIQNTTYYVWVKDEAGNVNATKTAKTKAVTNMTITGTSPNTKIVLNPSGVTNQDVVATVSSSSVTAYDIQTSQDGENWITIDKQTFELNGTIYARFVDSTGQYGASVSKAITNIDKVKPTIENLTATTSSITIVSATDDVSKINGYGVTEDKTPPDTWTSVTAKISNN